ncbi:MAG: hypothetical protein NC824_04105 [Candidatus Omnitrophica bacterium]|nr:hypothetical protein [Candidatus Omnitrophota bacterium]
MLEFGGVEESMKKKLNEIYKNLNPAELKRKITQLQEELFERVRRKRIYERNLEKEKVFV